MLGASWEWQGGWEGLVCSTQLSPCLVYSSVAMAKAALEAINGVNMFGKEVRLSPTSGALPRPCEATPPTVTSRVPP